jgi:hypothetical protein
MDELTPKVLAQIILGEVPEGTPETWEEVRTVLAKAGHTSCPCGCGFFRYNAWGNAMDNQSATFDFPDKMSS